MACTKYYSCNDFSYIVSTLCKRVVVVVVVIRLTVVVAAAVVVFVFVFALLCNYTAASLLL